MAGGANGSPDIAALLAAARPGVVRLCARLSGSPECAEDLAQETLVEAWRHADRLRDATGVAPWLGAIARNICLRWARRRGRERARVVAPLDEAAWAVADEWDLAVELEREDLARLLDQALALLPPETRVVLLARCVEELPQAAVALRLGLSEGAVALRLGLSEGAVAMRLRRGKLALRRLLAGELAEAAAACGAGAAADGRWEDARLWCPLCGTRRLQACLVRATGALTVRCPGCTPAPGPALSRAAMPHLHQPGGTARAGVARLLDWVRARYWAGTPAGVVRCPRCGRPVSPRVVPFDGHGLAPRVRHGVATACAACGHRDLLGLNSFLLALPAARRFWRAQGRVRLLAERAVETDGQAAAVLGYESATGAARCEVVVSLATLAALDVRGPGAG